MTDTIHQRLRDWLIASANGSLSPAERESLANHLANCPTCHEQACDPALIEELQSVMERHRQMPLGMEERILARVQDGTGPRHLAQTPRSQRHLRVAIRVCLAVLIAGLLAIRTLDLRWSLGEGWAGKVWATVSQFVLREPSYGHSELAAGNEGLLASCHELAANLVGVLLWGLLLVLASQLGLEIWRRRRGTVIRR